MKNGIQLMAWLSDKLRARSLAGTLKTVQGPPSPPAYTVSPNALKAVHRPGLSTPCRTSRQQSGPQELCINRNEVLVTNLDACLEPRRSVLRVPKTYFTPFFQSRAPNLRPESSGRQ
jgi:hypothetical protein